MFTFERRKAAWIAGTEYDAQQGDRCFVYVPDEIWAQPTTEDQFPVMLFNGSVALARWSRDTVIPFVEIADEEGAESRMEPIADGAVAFTPVG